MRHGSQKTNHFDFAISPFYLTNLNYGTGYVLFDLWIDCDRTREQFRSERLRLRVGVNTQNMNCVLCVFHVEFGAVFIGKSSWKDRIAEL